MALSMPCPFTLNPTFLKYFRYYYVRLYTHILDFSFQLDLFISCQTFARPPVSFLVLQREGVITFRFYRIKSLQEVSDCCKETQKKFVMGQV